MKNVVAVDKDARIEELEELVRQMRQAFAPQLTFPSSWKLTPAERQIIQGLLARQVFTPSQYQYYVEQKKGEERVDYRNMSVYMYRIRKILEPFGVAVVCHFGVGYSIPPADKIKVYNACQDEIRRQWDALRKMGDENEVYTRSINTHRGARNGSSADANRAASARMHSKHNSDADLPRRSIHPALGEQPSK